MALEKTYEELLASKINPRNPSAVLPVIYNLRKKSFEEYFPPAPERIVFSNSIVGATGTTAVFDSIPNNATCAKGGTITLAGTATYKLVSVPSGTFTETRAAINIIAQIDKGAKQVRALATQIGDDGTFSFTIPSEITQELSVGAHYVYIDAASPDNQPFRLFATVASGGLSDDPKDERYYARAFTITA